MLNINEVTLLGYVGTPPTIRLTANGDKVANIFMLTSEKWTDSEGNKHERTTPHTVTAFKGLAAIVGDYVAKGDPILVKGKLSFEKWPDKETGEELTKTSIIAENIVLLSGKKEELGLFFKEHPEVDKLREDFKQWKYNKVTEEAAKVF